MAASSSSSRRFEGKVVVVTGASYWTALIRSAPSTGCRKRLIPLSPHILGGGAGIGAAICRRFYQEGAQVCTLCTVLTRLRWHADPRLVVEILDWIPH